MNRFIKSSLLVGALLSATGASLCVPAQADNNQQKYLNNMAVQMYKSNVANGMNPLTGGIYSPYVNGAIYNQGGHHHHHSYNNNYNAAYANPYNNAYNNGYYNPNYGYQNYGYGNQYHRPSVFSQLINGAGY